MSSRLAQLTYLALFEVTCALFPSVVYYGDSADLQCPGGKYPGYTLHIFSLPLLTLFYAFIHFVKKTIVAMLSLNTPMPAEPRSLYTFQHILKKSDRQRQQREEAIKTVLADTGV